MPPQKRCVICGASFNPSPGRSQAQWQRQRFCTTACANRYRARQQRHALTTQQGWARSWERRRAIEDRADLKTWKPKHYPSCSVAARPATRLFIGRTCKACGAQWVSHAAMHDAPYCKPCNRARWRETHYERAARYGAEFHIINPTSIFERDGWRCQLCGRKTQRSGWPNPRRATLDHIVPLSRGGHHVESNLQCACWRCNTAKGHRSANDQLRLAC